MARSRWNSPASCTIITAAICGWSAAIRVKSTQRCAAARKLAGCRADARGGQGQRSGLFHRRVAAGQQAVETQFPLMLKTRWTRAGRRAPSSPISTTPICIRRTTESRRKRLAPMGRKGRVRRWPPWCCRRWRARRFPCSSGGPEFYGPGNTQSITNALLFDLLKQGRRPRVPLRDDTRRTLIWTPDASRALAALGNTADAFGQTWHLPCCEDRPTYGQLATMACEAFGSEAAYALIGKWTLTAVGLFSAGQRSGNCCPAMQATICSIPANSNAASRFPGDQLPRRHPIRAELA